MVILWKEIIPPFYIKVKTCKIQDFYKQNFIKTQILNQNENVRNDGFSCFS
jgi:hypothetical protein